MNRCWSGWSYDIPPPPMSKDDDGYAGKDRRYANLDEANIPLTECLKDTVARFLPFGKIPLLLRSRLERMYSLQLMEIPFGH